MPQEDVQPEVQSRNSVRYQIELQSMRLPVYESSRTLIVSSTDTVTPKSQALKSLAVYSPTQSVHSLKMYIKDDVLSPSFQAKESRKRQLIDRSYKRLTWPTVLCSRSSS